ncbi:MAG: YjgN family protein [Actinobacteria bacterium]|nr:YjgN family protein [Actinomycetota bacterium]
MKGKFKFEGNGGALFCLFFVQGILTAITLGIYYPWAMVKIIEYFAECLTLDGKKFEFGGNGGELFCLFFVNALLTGITLGIYYPFAMLKVEKYFTENISLDGKAFAFSDDNGCDFWCVLFVQCLITGVTLGIYYPWAMVKIQKYLLERTSYEGKKFSTTANGGELFCLFFVQGLLTLITLGIYYPWAMAKIMNYLISSMTYGENEKFELNLAGGKMFCLMVVQGGILVSITLGIYTPWYVVNYYKYIADNLEVKSA